MLHQSHDVIKKKNTETEKKKKKNHHTWAACARAMSGMFGAKRAAGKTKAKARGSQGVSHLFNNLQNQVPRQLLASCSFPFFCCVVFRVQWVGGWRARAERGDGACAVPRGGPGAGNRASAVQGGGNGERAAGARGGRGTRALVSAFASR